MQRLRPLNEQECYLRCYGWMGDDDAVTVKRPGDDTPEAAAVLTERIRLAFEARLDEREPEAAQAELALRAISAKKNPVTEPVLRRADVAPTAPSAVPDVLAPGLAVVFCGINPGFHSDAKAAHFANPRNDFWRLLHAAGFTPRLVDPADQHDVLRYRIGITNAAYRTTRGSSDLRTADFAGSAERLERLALELRPRAIGFVGKEAYRGPFGGRPAHGLQERRLGETLLFVLPSTSPANAAVRWDERLRWFLALRELVP